MVNRELRVADVLELEAEDMMRHWLARYVWWGRRWLALRILGQSGGIRYMSVFEAGRVQGAARDDGCVAVDASQGREGGYP